MCWRSRWSSKEQDEEKVICGEMEVEVEFKEEEQIILSVLEVEVEFMEEEEEEQVIWGGGSWRSSSRRKNKSF